MPTVAPADAPPEYGPPLQLRPGDRKFVGDPANPGGRYLAVWFEPGIRYLGFGQLSLPRWPMYEFGQSNDTHYVRFPMVFFVALFAVATAILWLRDRRILKPGHCPTCAYDLRASKGKCPECGTPIAPEPG